MSDTGFERCYKWPVRAWWLVVVAAPLLLLVLLLARPSIDGTWENHPAHFWLVLGAAALATALGWAVNVAARRRRDARLLLISLAFIASSGFFGLHALATPGVLLAGPNAGFELATPFGLLIAGIFAAASALELSPRRAALVIRGANVLLGALVALMAVWAFVSLTERPPLDDPLAAEELNGWQLVLAAVGVGLYALAALGYLRLYRRRPARFVFTFALAFALLAEAMIVIAWATNWQVSWWEWHILMLGAFVLIAHTARTEWHEERFSPLYLDETLAGARDVQKSGGSVKCVSTSTIGIASRPRSIASPPPAPRPRRRAQRRCSRLAFGSRCGVVLPESSGKRRNGLRPRAGE